MKGESSHWFNNHSGFDSHKLNWQNDYFTVSVSESVIDTVRAYIDNQVFHHKKQTFEEVYQLLIKKYGFKPSDFN